MNWAKQIKDSCAISEVVARYCAISKQSTGRYVLKCPFHQEKTPSCVINDQRSSFYCFGCKESGDVIRFVQLIENIDFISACKKIAAWYSIDLQKNHEPAHELRVSDAIKNWCIENLHKNSEVLNYLHERGLSQDTINKFGIGWFGTQQDFLRFCEKNKISISSVESVGIKHNMLFLFENRIIFPITLHGKVIGFGGRRFYSKDQRCKYINTSETEYFSKRNVLYGYDQLKSNSKELFIVEGYMDVCMCSQNGIDSVSSLGTAIGKQHVEAAWNKVDEVTIWFDGDFAGQTAAAKIALDSLEIIRPGKLLSFLTSPPGEDPASFLQSKYDLEILVNKKEYLMDKIWHIYGPKPNSKPELAVAAYKSIIGLTERIQNRDLKRLYVQDFKRKWFNKVNDRNVGTNLGQNKNIDKQPIQDPKQTYEVILLATIYYYPEILNHVCDYLLSMDLSDELHEIRERLLRPQGMSEGPLACSGPSMLEYEIGLCTLQKLNRIAPFTKSDDSTILVSGWMEVFSFYLDCMQSGRLK